MRYGLKKQDFERIKNIFSSFPEVDKAILYGSRAKGNFKPTSDIDMNQFVRLISLVLLLVFLSCHKNEETNFPTEFPGWLKSKITEVTTDTRLCEITTVTFIEYNGKKYYHLYCMIWSCAYCQLFDEEGNRPDWDNKGWDDFFAKKKDIQTVPACK